MRFSNVNCKTNFNMQSKTKSKVFSCFVNKIYIMQVKLLYISLKSNKKQWCSFETFLLFTEWITVLLAIKVIQQKIKISEYYDTVK